MAINKARTSVWMKAILILIIIAFVTSFISIVASPFAGNGNQAQNPAASTDPVAQLNAQYQPQVAALNQVVASQPTSYTALVNLGNTYFDWASKLQEASQTSTSAAGADAPLWIAAKDAYGRALAVEPGDSSVSVDYSIVTFYGGDTPGAIATAEGVTKSDPSFAPAWFNLGIFYEFAGDNTKALAAFEQYVKLDPQGKKGNVSVAREKITQLKAGK